VSKSYLFVQRGIIASYQAMTDDSLCVLCNRSLSDPSRN